MVEHCYHIPISLVSILEEYMNKFKLYDYEKYWLLSILYIPIFSFDKIDDIEKMKELINTLEYCKCVEKIEKKLSVTT